MTKYTDRIRECAEDLEKADVSLGGEPGPRDGTVAFVVGWWFGSEKAAAVSATPDPQSYEDGWKAGIRFACGTHKHPKGPFCDEDGKALCVCEFYQAAADRASTGPKGERRMYDENNRLIDPADAAIADRATADKIDPPDDGKTADAQMPGVNPVWCGRTFRHPSHITVPGSAWCAGEPTAAHVESTPSRSSLKREAVQRGEPMPSFDDARADAENEYVRKLYVLLDDAYKLLKGRDITATTINRWIEDYRATTAVHGTGASA